MSKGYGRLNGKTALITGAGTGIGFAMAKLFVAEGAQVAAIARRQESIDKWTGVDNVLPIQADITRLADINRMVDQTEKRFGKVDILCNVAGINDCCFPLDDTSDERWDKVLDLDLKAPFQISRRVIKGMMERGSGVILNIGSLTAFRGLHGPSYCAAKSGLIGMTLSIAVAYANRGIRCNAINPGPVANTEIGAGSGGEFHQGGWKMALDIIRGMPMQQRCEPEDLAPTALFLCSDEAKHVNGAIVAVDGGMSAC
jgi:NAD(P)-dependent dehydrogenase (short-subunit alcohol dehydrogenase family)